MSDKTFYRVLSLGLIMLCTAILYVFEFKMKSLADEMVERAMIELRDLQLRSCEMDNLLEECHYAYGS